jgi:hypothetical protein
MTKRPPLALMLLPMILLAGCQGPGLSRGQRVLMLTQSTATALDGITDAAKAGLVKLPDMRNVDKVQKVLVPAVRAIAQDYIDGKPEDAAAMAAAQAALDGLIRVHLKAKEKR